MRNALISVALVILIALLASASIAEEDPVLIHVAELLEENVDISNKYNHYIGLDANGETSWFIIGFDWREGNEHIVAMSSYTERCYTLYPVDTLEKIRCLLDLLNHFDEINSMLPNGVDLSYEIYEADGSKTYITLENYESYLKQYRLALGIE